MYLLGDSGAICTIEPQPQVTPVPILSKQLLSLKICQTGECFIG